MHYKSVGEAFEAQMKIRVTVDAPMGCRFASFWKREVLRKISLRGFECKKWGVLRGGTVLQRSNLKQKQLGSCKVWIDMRRL